MTDTLPCGHPTFTTDAAGHTMSRAEDCPCRRGYEYVRGQGYASWRWAATRQPEEMHVAPPAPRAADYGRERYG